MVKSKRVPIDSYQCDDFKMIGLINRMRRPVMEALLDSSRFTLKELKERVLHSYHYDYLDDGNIGFILGWPIPISFLSEDIDPCKRFHKHMPKDWFKVYTSLPKLYAKGLTLDNFREKVRSRGKGFARDLSQVFKGRWCYIGNDKYMGLYMDEISYEDRRRNIMAKVIIQMEGVEKVVSIEVNEPWKDYIDPRAMIHSMWHFMFVASF
jgi:hypothetical protein